MDFVPPAIGNYVKMHASPESPVLKALDRETHRKTLLPQMLCGHIQGQWLQIISKLMQPKLILEIGTYTGYSAICLALGLKQSGQLHTIDINEEFGEIASKYFKKARLGKRIKQHFGEALDIIPKLRGTFDLVFIDADKINYRNYYELCLPRLRKGGLIIADNALWSGKVTLTKKDKDTEAIDLFNKTVLKDKAVENVLVPLRDGIMVILKK